MRLLRGKTIAVFMFLFILIPCFAQWNADKMLNNPVAAVTGLQKYPVMCSDGAGGAIIAWYDDRDNSSGFDLYVQRINITGNIMWTLNGIGLASTSMLHTSNESGSDLDIVEDGSGGAVIVFVSGSAVGNTREIRAQRVDANGSIMWNGNGGFPMVACNAAEGQFAPRVTRANDGFFVLVWQDFRSATNIDIYGQRLHPTTGANQWTSTGAVVNAALNDQTQADVVSTGSNGEVIVAWRDQRQGVGSSDVYAQKMTSAGVRVWLGNETPTPLLSGRAICTAGSNEDRVMLCTDGAGGAIIAWHDFRNGSGDVYAQRIDGTNTGTVLWTADGVQVATNNTTQIPESICFSTGGSVISYTQRDAGTPNNNDIYIQKLDVSNGSLLWGANGLLICDATEHQQQSKVTSDDNGGAVVCWSDERAGISTDDIYAQRINSAGTIQWLTANGVLVSNAPLEQTLPVVINNGCITIFAWRDGRNTNADYNIFANSLKCDGSSNGNNYQYRSIATGNWNAASSWEMFVDGNWVAATSAPDNVDGLVTIRSPHTVSINSDMTIDEIVIDNGATLEISFSTLTITNSQLTDDILCNGTLSILGGFISGEGKLTVNGVYNWQLGFVDLPVQINSGGVFNKTGNNVTLENIITINTGGIMNWSAGSITCENGIINNSGFINYTGFSLLLTAITGSNAFNNLSGGIMTVAASSRITFGIPVNNQGIFNGVGEYRFSGSNATFSGNGIIQPGNSPGIITFHFNSGTAEMFNNSSNLNIEIQSNAGPGTGYDQLAVIDDIPLVLRGNLTVTETGTVPNGTYTIITLTGATGISGNFTGTNLPPGYTIQINNDNVQVIKNLAPTPVKLISFTIVQKNKNVLLQWVTENEINNSHFDIQRSADGRNYFNIGRVNASLFPGGRMTYSFSDIQPGTGINFYRLKQVDLDAKFQYSPVRRIDLGLAEGGLLVYPNPVKDFIQFEFKSNAKKVWVNIYDAKGNRIMQQELSYQPVLKIPVHSLAAGIYYLQITDGNNTNTGKFIIGF